MDALGVTNETFVLYTADHGDQLGDHFLWRKGFPFEVCNRRLTAT